MKKTAFAALLAPVAVLVTALRQSIQTSKEIKQNAEVIDPSADWIQAWERGFARLCGSTQRVTRGNS